MPWVGFEPTIPALELVKIVHTLDGAATVVGKLLTDALLKSCYMGSSSPRQGAQSGCRQWRGPPDMKVSYQYTE
jgi:hypothetical protein